MDVYFKAAIAVIFLVFFTTKTRLIAKLRKFLCNSKYYKGYFAGLIKEMTDQGSNPDSPLFSLKKAQFAEIEKKLEELPGDALEIGAGAGASLHFLRLPKGCSLVVVDYNPHFEPLFRETLAKYPEIHLKEYLVQSAVDMSNIPDDSFSAVFTTDVLCSIDEDLVRKMLKEIKRVLKPNGCFYFLEHVIDKPGTCRRFLQNLICWFHIWQFIGDGCHCNKETWHVIQEAGFKNVTLSYSYVPPLKKKHIFDKMFLSFIMYIVRLFLHGYATK